MSKQVLSIEQMKHLHELGLDTSKASMQYVADNNDIIFVVPKECEYHIKDVEDGYIICDALTLPDILDFLPYKIVTSYLNIGKKSFSGDILFYIEYSNFGGYAISCFRNDSLIDAAYEMLCWCIEKGYIPTDK